MSTRMRFEQWIVKQPELTYKGSLQRDGDGYAYGPTEIAWRGYLAGTTHATERAKDIAFRLEDPDQKISDTIRD